MLYAIKAFAPVTERLATAGQPSAEAIPALRSAGFERVINLGLLGQGLSPLRRQLPRLLLRRTVRRPAFAIFRGVIYSTPRLLVRRFQPGDLMDAYAILSDPEISKYEHWDVFDLEEVREDLEAQAAVEPGTPRVWNEFAVTLKDGGTCIGNISFKRSDPGQAQVEIGFHFASAWHGKGYGKEAVTGLIDWLWSLKLHRIWAVADTRNVGSWKLMEKLGMRREGYFRENCFVKGAWADEYLYALLEPEWRALRAGESKLP